MKWKAEGFFRSKPSNDDDKVGGFLVDYRQEITGSPQLSNETKTYMFVQFNFGHVDDIKAQEIVDKMIEGLNSK